MNIPPEQFSGGHFYLGQTYSDSLFRIVLYLFKYFQDEADSFILRRNSIVAF